MYEILVISVGIALGLVFRGVRPPARALAWIVGGGVVGGALISVLSGELEMSLAFRLFDAGQGAVAGVLTYAAAGVARARA